MCPTQPCGCDARYEKLSNSRSGHHFVTILLILLLKMASAPWPGCYVMKSFLYPISSLCKFYYCLKKQEKIVILFLIVKLICRVRVMEQWAKHLLGKITDLSSYFLHPHKTPGRKPSDCNLNARKQIQEDPGALWPTNLVNQWALGQRKEGISLCQVIIHCNKCL